MEMVGKTKKMKNGVEIPVLGFGTYKAGEKDGSETICTAIEAGYRYFDTASFYKTESFIGEAIQKSGLKRDEFFIATKLWKDEMGYEKAKEALNNSLERLQTDYLDLYMIHWPLPEPSYSGWRELDCQTWRALEEMYEEGKVRAIGLSNFLPHHIENILKSCRIEPMTNQLEFHPGYTQERAVAYCLEKGMVVQGWSPLGRRRLANESLIQEIAQSHNISEAQVCLRYALEKGVIPLPKSSSKDRMKKNMDIFSFSLTSDEMFMLDTMPQAGWSGEHPDRERVKI